MFLEYVDFKRPAWDADTLASLLERLHENGYQGLTGEVHHAIGRFATALGERPLGRTVGGTDPFMDVLIPPAQSRARVILHHRAPEMLRVVIAGRFQHEVRMVSTALKLHLESSLGTKLDDLIVDEGGRASLDRFRRDVVPALQLGSNGERVAEIRNPLGAQLLRAMRHQPAVRGRPTLLGSQLATLAPERPADQTRDAMEQLVAEGALERWHIVLCREAGQWLTSTPNAEEMRKFVALNLECPHCGRRVSEEQMETAYRLGEHVQAYVSDNRWMCDLIEASLRRFGVQAVAVRPGAGPVDGAACYQGTLILFRAKENGADAADIVQLRARAKQLEGEGWRVSPLLVADRSVPPEGREMGVTVVEGIGTLDAVLEQTLKAARDATVETLLPASLRLAAVPLADLLPTDD
ncbi:MAG TPA: hypothetical protein VJ206_04730 [bacterium]|nr:hypothetical protein [bacterium]